MSIPLERREIPLCMWIAFVVSRRPAPTTLSANLSTVFFSILPFVIMNDLYVFPWFFDRLVSGDGHSCHRSEYTIELLHDCGSHTFWHPLILLHFCGSGRSSSSGWKSILSHGFQFDRSLLCIWFSFVLMVSRFVFLLISQDTIRTTTTMLNKDPCWMRFPSQSLKNWTNSLTLLLVALRWLLHGPSSSWTMLRTTAMLFTVFLYFLAVIGVVMQECSSLGNWTQQVYFTPYQDDILDMRVDYQCILSSIPGSTD